jgi:GcrA cell cycle regulator
MSWTDAKIQILRDLWGTGQSASDIAKHLGGMTRNAVIGKANRLKLSQQAAASKTTAPASATTKAAVVAQMQPKAKTMLRAAPSMAAPDATPRTVLLKRATPAQAVAAPQAKPVLKAQTKPQPVSALKTTERQCRWPFGDPRSADFKFCGCGALETLPYCLDHARIAYQNFGRGRKRDDEGAQATSQQSKPAPVAAERAAL